MAERETSLLQLLEEKGGWAVLQILHSDFLRSDGHPNKQQSVFTAGMSHGNSPPEEVLSTEEFMLLLNVLYIEEASPKYVKAGLVLSLAEFAQFCVFPFLQIAAPGKQVSKRIEFWSYAPGLLPDAPSRLFLGSKRRLAIYQISEFILRVVLSEICTAPSSERSLSFEVQLTAEMKESVGVSEDSTGQLRMLRPELLQRLEPVFEEVAQRMKTVKELLLIRVSVASQEVTVQYLQDLPTLRAWRLVTSTSPTHPAPEPILLPYSQLLAKFGLLPKALTFHARELVAGFVLDSVLVERIIDSDEILVRLSAVEEICGCRRLLPFADETVPVTLALVGVKARIIGVRAVAWNVQQTLESGVLWYAESQNYRTTLEGSGTSLSKKKKKLEKADRLSEMAERETSLLQLLEEKGGWAVLLNALTLGSEQKPRLRIISPAGALLFLDRLETYLSPI